MNKKAGSDKHPTGIGISHHFKREAVLMFAIFIAIILLGILAAFIIPKLML